MGFPSWYASGSKVAVFGAITLPPPAGFQPFDIGLAAIKTAAESLNVPAGWEHVPGSPFNLGTPATAGAIGLNLLWHRFLADNESSPAFGPTTTESKMGRLVAVRGCARGGSPFSGDPSLTVDSDGTSQTAVAILGNETEDRECLVLAFVFNAVDGQSADQVDVTSWANLSLGAVTARGGFCNPLGVGGGFDIGSGELAEPGIYGPTTATLLNASPQVRLSLALKPHRETPLVNQPAPFVMVT